MASTATASSLTQHRLELGRALSTEHYTSLKILRLLLKKWFAEDPQRANYTVSEFAPAPYDLSKTLPRKRRLIFCVTLLKRSV